MKIGDTGVGGKVALTIRPPYMNSFQIEVQNHLIKIQYSFKDDLLTKVESFRTETDQFYQSYATVSDLVKYTTRNDPGIAALGRTNGGGTSTKRS